MISPLLFAIEIIGASLAIAMITLNASAQEQESIIWDSPGQPSTGMQRNHDAMSMSGNELIPIRPGSSASQSVRVQMPNGQIVNVMDSPTQRWWKSEQFSQYQRFYYDPARRVYRVAENKPAGWPNPARWQHENSSTGPRQVRNPMQASRECPPGMPSYGIGTGCE